MSNIQKYGKRNFSEMTDSERGREMYQLVRLERRMKKAHPAFRRMVSENIEVLAAVIASRFVEELGPDNALVKNLIKFSQENPTEKPTR